MKVIAHIHNGFSEKFGVPRQSGLTENISRIVFEPEYRDENALRGIEGYSHLWILWIFSGFADAKWSPTVRPPRLGGNTHAGVFATRSPHRPNPVGLSSVRLIGTEKTAEGVVLIVSGADMTDGTPVIDIKPYLSFTDSHTDAVCGFADDVREHFVGVSGAECVPEAIRSEIESLISQDPRPAYKEDGGRIYGMSYNGYNVKFRVENNVASIISCDICQ